MSLSTFLLISGPFQIFFIWSVFGQCKRKASHSTHCPLLFCLILGSCRVALLLVDCSGVNACKHFLSTSQSLKWRAQSSLSLTHCVQCETWDSGCLFEGDHWLLQRSSWNKRLVEMRLSGKPKLLSWDRGPSKNHVKHLVSLGRI